MAQQFIYMHSLLGQNKKRSQFGDESEMKHLYGKSGHLADQN